MFRRRCLGAMCTVWALTVWAPDVWAPSHDDTAVNRV